jgi:hypothetical protein
MAPLAEGFALMNIYKPPGKEEEEPTLEGLFQDTETAPESELRPKGKSETKTEPEDESKP